MIATPANKYTGTAASCATQDGTRYFIAAKDEAALTAVMTQLGFREVKAETLFPAEVLVMAKPQLASAPASAKKKGRK